MAKIFDFYCDIHRYAPHALDIEFVSSGILGGDIIDRDNVKRKELPQADEELAQLEAEFGPRMVDGNHELRPENAHDFYRSGDILFVHGHMQMFGKSFALKYMNKRPGKGSFGRWLSKVGDFFRRKLDVPIMGWQMDNFLETAKKHQVHNIVCGHHHPKRPSIKDINKDGYKLRVIICPRGHNKLVYDEDTKKVMILKSSKEILIND